MTLIRLHIFRWRQSDEQFEKVALAIIVLIQTFNLTGIVSNSLSIAVFLRLGFSEPSNVSLFSLAIIDLVTTVLSVWVGISITPAFRDARLPFNTMNVSLLTGAGPWTFTTRCVAWITALITFERCLCILIPLKVKRLVTPKTTGTAVVIIAVFTVGPFIGIYWRWEFVWIFSPHLNRTILDIAEVNTAGIILMEAIFNGIVGVIQPLLAFLIVLVCTVILIVHLRRSSAWRRSVTSAQAQGGQKSERDSKVSSGTNAASAPTDKARLSTKEERVVRMVATIATIFIVCFTPSCVMILFSTIFPDFTGFGRYRYMYTVLFLISALGEAVSASVNIIIYYNMASKYRQALRRLLRWEKEEKR